MTPRRVIAAAVVAVGVLGTGAGWAYYRAAVLSGGAATATTATALPLTTTATTAGATLYPGATGSLVVRVTNPNAAAVRVRSVAANGTVTACTTPAVTVTTPAGGLPFTLAAGETRTVTLAGAVAMGAGASSDCQGKTLTVPVLMNG